jgi:hypothetical protein
MSSEELEIRRLENKTPETRYLNMLTIMIYEITLSIKNTDRSADL